MAASGVIPMPPPTSRLPLGGDEREAVARSGDVEFESRGELMDFA